MEMDGLGGSEMVVADRMKSLISSRTLILASPVKLHKMAWIKLLETYFSIWNRT